MSKNPDKLYFKMISLRVIDGAHKPNVQSGFVSCLRACDRWTRFGISGFLLPQSSLDGFSFYLRACEHWTVSREFEHSSSTKFVGRLRFSASQLRDPA
ncbi:hypothetical protein MA16_Dca025726 [Dendrobium catenatum]|uniref:Uncharacterized protein n=1 Tax=Dendrobium catenatum TaxID=906689 RepID=A0A2I0XBG4_9ASPA|nr:hypothetical protein MA16_Dca025726 [Dendrobium catenatum]